MGEKKTILILDDEPHVVTYLSTLLEDHGYATVSASNGIEGMEKIKAKQPDLITLDITMPEQSGIRFYRDLRENPDWISIPVIKVTFIDWNHLSIYAITFPLNRLFVIQHVSLWEPNDIQSVTVFMSPVNPV